MILREEVEILGRIGARVLLVKSRLQAAEPVFELGNHGPLPFPELLLGHISLSPAAPSLGVLPSTG